MINLLPPDELRELRAARANTLLLRYNIFMVGVLVFILLILATVFFYLSSAKARAEAIQADNNQKVSSYAQVKVEADKFRTSLSSAKQILDKEARYSKTLTLLAQQLPSGVVFDNLSLDVTTFGTPTTLVLRARDRNAVLAAKDSFEKSPLFSDVHLLSITGTTGQKSGSGSAYPVTANLSVTINKDAAK